MQLFLPFGHLEAMVGLLTGLISISLCLREPATHRKRDEELQSVEQSEHTWHLSVNFVILHGQVKWHPKAITIVTSKVTNDRITITMVIIRNKFETLWELPRCDPETQRGKVIRKRAPALPQTLFSKKCIYACW